MRNFIFYFFISTFLFFTNQIFSQNPDLTGTDLSAVKIDNYSDSQIEALLNKAEKQGYSIEQVISLASAKGLSPSEVSKLRKRIEKIQTEKSKDPDSKKFKDRSRTYLNAEDVKDKQQTDKKEGLEEKTKEEGDLFDVLVTEKRERPEDKIFGFSMFNRTKLTFEPNLNIATPQNYQLGANDELVIEIWGASQQTYEEKISPEGTIFIENLGVVSLNGLTIEEATLKLRKVLSGIYSGLNSGNTFLKVSLGKNVRSIKVNIIGEVYVPGTYTIPSFSTVFNALYAAGGL